MSHGRGRTCDAVVTRDPMTRRTAVVAAVGLILALGALWARLAAQAPVTAFASRTHLVEVYATVTDDQGALVTNLGRDAFDVRENGAPQVVSAFAAGEFPLTVALGVDRSWSMAGRPLRLAKLASTAFLRALKPDDRSMVLAIGGDAEIVAPLSADRVSQARTIEALDPWGTTALYDSIIVALDRLEPEPGRQALVVVSDGTDRHGQATASQAVARARRSNALVYPIAVGGIRPPVLAELAVLTGGRSFQLRGPKEIEAALAAIARELRYQYLLGYAPSDPIQPGHAEWRSITVGLRKAPPGTRVRARDGYTTE